MNGWIGCDFDSTLAFHDGSTMELGPPIPRMLERVKSWLAAGIEVKIVTARVALNNPIDYNAQQVRKIKAWCIKYLGQELDVTCSKDFRMLELWDDRCVQVEMNTGRILGKSSGL